MKQRELFRMEGLPTLQNKTFADAASALASPKGDMVLVQNMETGLVHNAAFDAGLLDYDADYQNEQAYSEVFKKHLDDVQTIIKRNFLSRNLIEVGCGKGYFLEYLQKLGYQITGIDPAYEGNNPSILKARFDASLGLSADGIVLRHVLEHIPQPLDFLSAIAKANGGKGMIYIEVPCLDWICSHRAWFDIFYEHVNYFRLKDFHRLFGTVHESGHVFGGQYLYVVADLATLRTPHLDLQDNFDFPADFLDGVTRKMALAKDRPGAIWGGSSKGVIFALYMQRAGFRVDKVIDINPAKQGKFLASSGVKVFGPLEGMQSMVPGDNVFVMNSNYLQEIIAMTNNQFNYIQVDQHEF